MQAFPFFGILPVIQAAAEIPTGINFACNSVHICICVCVFVYSVILKVANVSGPERW